MKEKLYDDLLVRLQAKDKLLRKKEIELLNRENRFNQKAAASESTNNAFLSQAKEKEVPSQSKSGTYVKELRYS
jgi:hypothetical protein